MNYIIKLIKSLLPILIIYILNFIIIFIISLIYTGLGNNDLELFVNNYLPYLLIPFYIITIRYIIKKYYVSQNKISPLKYYPLLYFGISLSTLLNMLIFLIKSPETKVTTTIFTSIITSSIIGPIFEEYLFRYYLLNKLKSFNSTKIAIILNSLIFGIIHTSLLNILYATILGLFLNIIYEKYQNINANILVHIGSNLIAIFLTEYSHVILILAILNFVISSQLIFYKKKV